MTFLCMQAFERMMAILSAHASTEQIRRLLYLQPSGAFFDDTPQCYFGGQVLA